MRGKGRQWGARGQGYVILGFRVPITSVGARGQGGVRGREEVRGRRGMRGVRGARRSKGGESKLY